MAKALSGHRAGFNIKRGAKICHKAIIITTVRQCIYCQLFWFYPLDKSIAEFFQGHFVMQSYSFNLPQIDSNPSKSVPSNLKSLILIKSVRTLIGMC